ncbi:MAG: hypothetical protein BWY75_01202 [bacterium ADurb.Bin425]|nr:MAG: hypothetical protein BWY75_01202 [bacterium ADurb.Bin425]
MTFSVSQTATAIRTDTGRYIWIHHIEIEGDMQTGDAASGIIERLARDFDNAVLVYIAHRKGQDSRFVNQFAFGPVQVAHANEGATLALHLRTKA